MANEKDYGIVIGIEYYKGSLSQLKGPHADAKRFSDWLQSSKGGDLLPENVKTLLSTQTYMPIKDDIDDWFLELLEGISVSGNRGRRLYLYFSGHGIASTANNSAMLLPKWSHLNRQYGLSSEQYLEQLVNNGLFKEIYIFMDCCRNRIANVSGSKPFFSDPKPSANSCEYLVFYSSEFDNLSYEVSLNNDGDTLNDLLPRGLFTEVLISGLNGAAADKNGNLNLDALIKYVNRALPQLALSRKKSQIPRTIVSFKTLNKPLTPAFNKKVDFEITFDKKNKSKIVLEDPDLNVIKKGAMSDGKWKLELSRGYHLLRKENEENGFFFYVDGLKNNLNYE